MVFAHMVTLFPALEVPPEASYAGLREAGPGTFGDAATALRFHGRSLPVTPFFERHCFARTLFRVIRLACIQNALRLVQLPDSGNALYSVCPESAASG